MYEIGERLKSWLEKLNGYKDRVRRGEKLTEEEQEDMYFLQEKYDDWASDGEYSY